ncbi:E3 ubiquitin-protein ligase Mdm2-like protein [Anopheles sinensis]|uniref:E3 ubiquitin-protein ligase Mdm2-like protein n=1 Tax=Anopheles sinensis TaxID=74873 RepID=A0A084WM09_ANOSI|nr:E3 ubiquitin-protein ligase Mdm2-like protein [Anopheles sinensis]
MKTQRDVQRGAGKGIKLFECIENAASNQKHIHHTVPWARRGGKAAHRDDCNPITQLADFQIASIAKGNPGGTGKSNPIFPIPKRSALQVFASSSVLSFPFPLAAFPPDKLLALA